MTRFRRQIGTAMLVAVVGAVAPAAAAEPARIRGSGDCAGCHTLKTGNFKTDFVLLNEFATWRLSDSHSLAYLALESKRGRDIGRQLGFEDVTRREAGCLGCHAPQAAEPSLRKESTLVLRKEGVGCESCHGASEHWFGPHSEGTWRGAPEEKQKPQMWDVRNPERKAELCVSCHVGDASRGRVVTHAMFAAGHPPLPSIEVASFAEQMPYHWRRGEDVPFFKNLLKSGKPEDRKLAAQYGVTSPPSAQARQVAASGLMTLAGQLDLVAQRCQFDAPDAAPRWPERAMPGFKDAPGLPSLWPQIAMAHSDCASCHHELAHTSWRQIRGFSGPPGRVPLAEWPLALNRVLGLRDDDRVALATSMRKLIDARDRQPFGDPVRLGKAAGEASAGLRASGARASAVTPKRLVVSLASLPVGEYPNFDSARQIVAALRAVQEEAGIADASLRRSLQEWAERLDLETPEKVAVRRAQQRLTIGILSKLATEGDAARPAFRTDAAFLDALDAFLRTGTLPADGMSAEAIRRILHGLTEHGGSAMTLALAKDGAARKELEDAHEACLRASLRRTRQYDPREFMAYLKKVRDRFPAP